MSFSDLFMKATGNAPYAYQRRLAEDALLPEVLEVPTGAGKTLAVLTSWLHHRAERPGTPRRLVYALPMRTLVEQTRDVVVGTLRALGLEDEVAVHVLMGGASAKDDWRLAPDRPQVLVGTIDMLLSAALNRGYGTSIYQAPVGFGLLNNDCRWVFDEVQLMGPALTTSVQLAGLRRALGTLVGCETLWVSATIDHDALLSPDHPELGPVLELQHDDRAGPLSRRLNAAKVLRRVDLTSTPTARHARAQADALRAAHVPGTRTLAVLNRVRSAQELFRALQRGYGGDGPRAVLLHSRFRADDRARHLADALAEPEGAGTMVVATQVVEAGVDLSSRVLATEPAPFSSIVQRLGRCNRAGEFNTADVLWFDAGEPKNAAPYEVEDVQATRAALLEREGESLSPERLGGIEVSERRDLTAVLRRRDLLDLFDTAPDLSGNDVDVAPFVREAERSSVSVFFREVEDKPDRSEPRPAPAEVLQAPIAEVRARPRAWAYDRLDGEWLRIAPRDMRPGQEVMLAASDGGYEPVLGWSTTSRGPVDVVSERGAPVEAQDDDHASVGSREWQSLSDHLEAVANEAARLLESQGIPAILGAALTRAAALHDVGKAHPAFQKMLLSGERDEQVLAGLTSTQWAKSPHRGGTHERRGFRHELASALALDGDEPDLVAYLVAAHHGRVRLAIRPAPEEQAPGDDRRFALGIHEGDELPEVDTPVGTIVAQRLSLAPMELGDDRSWSRRALALRDRPDLGPFRLGLLEALVRVADWRASA